METLHFSTLLNAPRERVWDTMFDDKTYRVWAAAFMPGSHFVGSWDKDSKIQFVSAGENGKMSGMTSVIVENNPHEFLSIKHLGLVGEGVEDTTSDEAKKWVGYENYTFSTENGKTKLEISIDTNDEMVSYMKETWPKAFQKLKELVEN